MKKFEGVAGDGRQQLVAAQLVSVGVLLTTACSGVSLLERNTITF